LAAGAFTLFSDEDRFGNGSVFCKEVELAGAVGGVFGIGVKSETIPVLGLGGESLDDLEIANGIEGTAEGHEIDGVVIFFRDEPGFSLVDEGGFVFVVGVIEAAVASEIGCANDGIALLEIGLGAERLAIFPFKGEDDEAGHESEDPKDEELKT